MAKGIRPSAWLSLLGLIILALGCGEAPTELHWAKSFREAVETARKEHRMVMMKFTAEWCGPCKDLETLTLSDPSVAAEMAHVVAVRLDVDTKEGRQVSDDFRVSNLPTVVFMTPEGIEISRVVGLYPPDQFLSAYRSAQAKSRLY